MKIPLLILLFFSSSANVSAQNWRSGWVYIEHAVTGLVMDVQGNVKATGTNVWPYAFNYSKAQMFKFSEHNIPDRYGDDARYIMAYDNDSSGSDFYLSVKQRPMVLAHASDNEPIDPGSIRDHVLLPLSTTLDNESPNSDKIILRNFAFSIEAKREVVDSFTHVTNNLSTFSVNTPRQIWKILPVSGEADTYYIQNAHFEEKMVIEPLDLSSGGTLVLSSFTGSNFQKWKISKTKPEEATTLKLSNFKWEEKYDQSSWRPWKWHYDQNIKGKLSWTNSNVSGLTKQNIYISSVGTNYETITLEPNKTSHEFKIKSSKLAKTEEHCFSVKAHNKWQAENWTLSDDLCEIPGFEETSSTPSKPTSEVTKLRISNCHSGKKSVRLWTYDLSDNDGIWKDHGTLGSQWQGSGCPFGSPKEINISDNHIYQFVAIDCGNLPPNNTQGSCHRLTTSQIQGGNGATLAFQIN